MILESLLPICLLHIVKEGVGKNHFFINFLIIFADLKKVELSFSEVKHREALTKLQVRLSALMEQNGQFWKV